MKKKSRTTTDKMILAIGGVIVVAAAGFFWSMTRPTDTAVPIVGAGHGAGAAAPAPKEDTIIIPELSQIAQSGKIAFGKNCSACHGENLSGTEFGPPLIHQLYVPGHHPDTAIASAAKNGVTSHHWRFGNMPPVVGITDANLRWITTYIREMQVANGIK